MSGRLRLACLIDTAKTGGAQRQLAGLLAHLPPEVDTTVCVWQETPARWGRVDFPAGRIVSLRGGALLRPAGAGAFARLVRLLRRERPDVLHATLGTANLIAPVAGGLAEVPVLTSRRDLGDWMRPRHRLLARCLAPRAHAVVANAEAVRQAAIRNEGLAPERVHVVPNAVDLPASLPPQRRDGLRTELGAEPGAIVLVQVATLTPAKDHATALRAARALADADVPFHWWMVGDGPLRGRLEQDAATAGLAERVRFVGNRPDAQALLQAGEIGILTSRSEGFPNAVLEAMAAGRAVVATETGGTAEAVVPGETGLLVPPHDADALAAHVLRLLRDPALRERLGRNGRARAAEHYTWERLTRRMLSLYQAVRADGGTRDPALTADA